MLPHYKFKAVTIMRLKRLTMAVAVLATAATLQAQTYNDTVRTHTWSVYVQGGGTVHHDMRGTNGMATHKPIMPFGGVGVKYNIKPWIRLGLNLEYDMLKSSDKDWLSTTTKRDFEIKDPSTGKIYPTTLNTKVDIFQNKNTMHYGMADLNVDFNIMELWHNRKAQNWNLWLGVGVGYLHGWSRNSSSVSYSELAEAKGDGYYNVYSHNYIKSWGTNKQVDAMYIPATLSLEYDITSRWTAGVFGRYCYLPLDKDLTPKGMCSAGLVLRFNFVSKKMPSNKKRFYQALRDKDEMKVAYEKLLADKQRENDGLAEKLRSCSKSNEELQALLDDCEKSKKIKQYDVFFTVDKTNITSQEKLRLKKFIKDLKQQGNYKLTVIGEASSDGVSSKNFKLSEGRLNNVVAFLKKQGIDDFSIKLEKAIGDSNGCPKEECRRVQIIVE